MPTYHYTGYMVDGAEVVHLVIARDGDEARRLGRQSAEADGRRVVLQAVKVVEESEVVTGAAPSPRAP